MDNSRSLRPLVIKLFLIPIAMFGFGYLLVPLYDVFCDVTGLNGKTGSISSVEASQLQVDTSRQIRVNFFSSVNQDGLWEFRPEKTSMMVNPGKAYTTRYFAKNLQNAAMTSQSVPSITPGWAASHFNKTECFCFTEQKFGALESKHMPVTFVIDNNVPQEVDTVNLSYTMFTKE